MSNNIILNYNKSKIIYFNGFYIIRFNKIIKKNLEDYFNYIYTYYFYFRLYGD